MSRTDRQGCVQWTSTAATEAERGEICALWCVLTPTRSCSAPRQSSEVLNEDAEPENLPFLSRNLMIKPKIDMHAYIEERESTAVIVYNAH